MKTMMQPSVSDLFTQATQTFDNALQAGIRLQGEATRWWSDMLQEANSLQKLQRRAQSLMNEIVPDAQKNVDQYLSLIGRNYRLSMDLMRQALEPGGGLPYFAAPTRLQDFWQESLGAMRDNARELVQINARTMKIWSELAERSAAQGAGAGKVSIELIAAGIKPLEPKAARPIHNGGRRAVGGARRRARAARPAPHKHGASHR